MLNGVSRHKFKICPSWFGLKELKLHSVHIVHSKIAPVRLVAKLR